MGGVERRQAHDDAPRGAQGFVTSTEERDHRLLGVRPEDRGGSLGGCGGRASVPDSIQGGHQRPVSRRPHDVHVAAAGLPREGARGNAALENGWR
jgi:hypothetical protein